MAARLDPFVDVMLRERADQLYLLPDEPVTLVKDGKARKVSKKPLTDQHIYALMVEVAPPEAADKIDQNSETEFDYAGANGLVRVRIVPEAGRLTAVISAIRRASEEMAAPPPSPPVPPVAQPPSPETTAKRAASQPAAAQAPAPPAQQPVAKPAPKAPRASVIAAAPMVDSPMSTPGELPGEFASSEFQAAEQKLGKLLRALVQSSSSDLHLRVGEPPLFRTHGEIKRQSGTGLSVNDLELLVLSIMPERNRGEWKEGGDSDFAYEIPGLARFRVNAARDRKGPVAVFRVIPAKVVTVEEMGVTKEVQQLCYLTKGLVLVTGPTGSGKSTTLCAFIDQFPADRQAQIRIMLSESLKGVIAQTLCKRIGGGRVAAREILLSTPAVANLIREGKTFQIPSIIQTSKKLGMVTLNDALLDLVEKKVVEPDEAYMKSVEKSGLAASLKARGFKITLSAEG